MAEVKRFIGSVPPTFDEFFDVILNPGTYRISQEQTGASLDGSIQDNTGEQILISFTESAYQNSFTVTGSEAQPLRMFVEAYQAGGPFNLVIESLGSGGIPDPDYKLVQVPASEGAVVFIPTHSGGQEYDSDVSVQMVTYPEDWELTLVGGPQFVLASTTGTQCNVPSYGRYFLSRGEEISAEVNFGVILTGCDTPPPTYYYEEGDPPQMSYVYEAEKGWSFDGNYIPHFAEVNWYFGDNPVDYTSIQKVRIHGLSQGRALISVASNGIQQDGYDEMYSEPQWVDLPRNAETVLSELMPKTNYTDQANRGLAIQLKFEGRNKDISKPEPGHVLQVLVVQSSPPGTGQRSG